MLFCTYQYFLFFSIVLALFYLGPRGWHTVLLLVASYLFYMSWNWKFIPLLAGLTVIDYVAALWIERSQGPGRRLALWISLAANLGFLGFFKYYNFAASNLAAILGLPENAWRLSIVLPLGISFHTFQSISYVVDVYRGQQKAIRRPLDYALFISFFPQLVAGPIVRARQFFHDHDAWTPPSSVDVKASVFLIVAGVVKKVAVADNLAVTADRYFGAAPGSGGAGGAWAAVFAFSLQIFFDFSGYTDIAIGSALLLGYHFPPNFRRPYLAASITDFWRRWHMSLSSWLRDYVYIPLGGNRRGRLRTYVNLLATMLLGGLWHGANWTFVVWGGYHGLLLAIERALGISRTRERRWSIRDAVRSALTFFLVSIGWVFFRASNLHRALAVIRDLATPGPATWPVEPALLVLVVAAVLLAVLEERRGLLHRARLERAWAVGLWSAVLLFVAEIFAAGNSLPFVYFQF